MSRFGELLRYYRTKCGKSDGGRPLTQAQLGELLGYTSQAISEWELGKSRIPHDQRQVLVNLVKALHECGGLGMPTEADTLLLAGDYRPLDADERHSISPGWGDEQATNPTTQPNSFWGMMMAYLEDRLARLTAGLRELRASAGEGQPPHWSNMLLAAMGRFTRGWSAENTWRVFLWVGVWLLGWASTFPFLHWPFATAEWAWLAAVIYAGGALSVPTLLAGLVPTHNDEFWRRQGLARSPALRLFTYQGAYIGFHVGYMLVFVGALAGHYLDLGPAPRLLEGLAAAGPIVLSYAAARQVPFNLWRAFKGLRITASDWGVLLAFGSFGPMWAWFFFTFHPWLLYWPIGLALIWCALAWVIWQERKANRKRGTSSDGGS